MAVWAPRSRRLNAILLGILWVVLSLPSLRLFGMDRGVYLDALDGVKKVNEQSFYTISDIIGSLSLPDECIFLVYALFAVGIMLLAIWIFNRRVWWCVLVYFSMSWVLHPMIQIRAANAIACFLLATVLWRSIRASLLLGLSVFWHSSAVMGVLGVLISERRYAPRMLMCIIACATLFCALGYGLGNLLEIVPIAFIQDNFTRYMLSMDVGENLGNHPLCYWGIALICMSVPLLAKYDVVARLSGGFRHANLWIMGLVFGLLVADIPALSDRSSHFLMAVEVFLVPCVAATYTKRYGCLLVIGYSVASTLMQVVKINLFEGMYF